MPTATIIAEFVNPPKPGKKHGSVKGNDGHYYGVDPSQLNQFVKGGTYTIEYDTRVYEGKEYRNFRRMDGAVTIPGVVPSGRPAHTQAVEMFVMGVIGRAMQGVGTLPDREILTTWVKALRRAWADGFADKPDPLEDDLPEF